jgi:histidinol-phosphate aminotransferase
MSLVRQNIKDLTAYIAGKPIEETKRELGLKTVYKLASNENPIGPSPMVVKAMKKAIKTINRYPDSNGFYLKKKLAAVYNLGQDNFLLGNGSDEIIDIIIKTFVNEDENIVTADNTFLEYQIIAKINNRKINTVPLKDFVYDLDGIKNRIDAKTKLIFIANPNNPTGTYVNKLQIREFLNCLPEQAILVLDEAYETFIDVRDFPDTLNYIGKENVILMKTFSKAYGLAGLRIGYAVARPELIQPMEKVRQPFNVNLLAQSAAIAALEDKKFLRKSRKLVLEGKNYFYREFDKLGLRYVPSVANFVLVDVKKDCVAVFKEMLKSGVIVRDMRQYGLSDFIRVTIGTFKENIKFIQALKEVLKT